MSCCRGNGADTPKSCWAPAESLIGVCVGFANTVLTITEAKRTVLVLVKYKIAYVGVLYSGRRLNISLAQQISGFGVGQ